MEGPQLSEQGRGQGSCRASPDLQPPTPPSTVSLGDAAVERRTSKVVMGTQARPALGEEEGSRGKGRERGAVPSQQGHS